MRDFFIRSLESIVNVLVILGAIGVVIAAFAAGFGRGSTGMHDEAFGGPVAFIVVLLGGFVYLTLLAGFIYLALGIYSNTKRTADAVERLQSRD